MHGRCLAGTPALILVGGGKSFHVTIGQHDIDLVHARRTQTDVGPGQWLWENQTGDFFRAFRISEQVDASKIWAGLKSGVLTLHLPKVEAAKPRKITVKGG